MTYFNNWDEFEKSAERLYLADPMKVRYTMKYAHSKGMLTLKVTDNKKCLLYKTEIQQDLRKIDKFIGNLIRDMFTNEAVE